MDEQPQQGLSHGHGPDDVQWSRSKSQDSHVENVADYSRISTVLVRRWVCFVRAAIS